MNELKEGELGHSYPTKETLSVPKDSTLLPEPVVTLNPKTRGLLQRYADRLREFLATQEDQKTATSKATRILNEVGKFREALKLAGLSTQSILVSFAKAFPEFKLEHGPKGGASYVSLRGDGP